MLRVPLKSLALSLFLLAALAALTGCETRRAHSADRRPATYQPATDPFAGARLNTGSGYRENKSGNPDHDADYFAIPKRK